LNRSKHGHWALTAVPEKEKKTVTIKPSFGTKATKPKTKTKTGYVVYRI